MKHKYFYTFAVFSGLTPLIIGNLIFFIWWFARGCFAVDFNFLEDVGFFWILISIPVAILGIFSALIFFIYNLTKYIKHSLFAFFIILINIPVLNLILIKEHEINSRAYLKIYNETSIDILDLAIKTPSFEKK